MTGHGGWWRLGRAGWGRVRPVVVAAGVVLAAVGVCGGLMSGMDSRGSSPPRPPASAEPPTAAPPATSRPARAAGPSAAEAPPSTGSPTAEGLVRVVRLPADLRFVAVAGVRLPASPTAGPRNSAGGLARGFARDPAGVVLAAAHLLVRVHPQVGADVFGPTLAGQVIGPHAAALSANVERSYRQLLTGWPVPYGQPAGRLGFRVAGFALDAYTPDQAGVRLLLEVPTAGGPVLGATSLRLGWHRGDWALVAPAGGAFTDTGLVTGTAGYTLWPPAVR